MSGVLNVSLGDLRPDFRVTGMKFSDGTSVSFAATDTGTLTVTKVGGGVVLDAVPVVLDTGQDSLTYVWQNGDFTEGGEYRATIDISFTDGKPGTWPNKGFYYIRVQDDLPLDYSLTVDRVKDGFSTQLSNEDLAGLIAIMDQADACLTTNGVHADIGRQLKVLGVRHIATMIPKTSSGGRIISERAISGASRAFQQSTSIRGSFYGDVLSQIDQTGCVVRLIENNAPVMFRSVGPKSEVLE